MAGEISKYLVSDIRDQLNDQEKKLIPADGILYNKLNHYQNIIMSTYYTTKQKYSYPLIEGETLYQVIENILKITSITFNADIPAVPIVKINNITSGDGIRYIELTDTSYTSADMMYVEAFIRPDRADKITAEYDPILDEAYHYYLEQCVLSEYRHLNEVFQPLKAVYQAIQELSDNLRSMNRAVIKPAFRNKINF